METMGWIMLAMVLLPGIIILGDNGNMKSK